MDMRTFKAVCADLAQGMTLQDSLKQRGATARMFHRCRLSQPAAERMYRQAREALGEHYLDEIVKISDGREPLAEGEIRDVRRDDLRVRARMWAAAKNAPRTLGDKLEIQHKGEVSLLDIIKQRDERLIGRGSTLTPVQTIDYTGPSSDALTESVSDFSAFEDDGPEDDEGSAPDPFS